MKRKKVLLLGQFKCRDLPGLALLKVLLEIQGPYDVLLAPEVPGLGIQPYLSEMTPHLVVFPQFMNRLHVAQAQFLRQNGIGVAVLPAEGTSSIREVRLQMAGKSVDLSSVDLLFVWNWAIVELIRTHKTIELERCVVAGVPRLDFHHPRFRQFLMSKERFCAR